MKLKQSKSLHISTISHDSYVQNYNSTDFIVQTNGSTSSIDDKHPGGKYLKII